MPFNPAMMQQMMRPQISQMQGAMPAQGGGGMGPVQGMSPSPNALQNMMQGGIGAAQGALGSNPSGNPPPPNMSRFGTAMGMGGQMGGGMQRPPMGGFAQGLAGAMQNAGQPAGGMGMQRPPMMNRFANQMRRPQPQSSSQEE